MTFVDVSLIRIFYLYYTLYPDATALYMFHRLPRKNYFHIVFLGRVPLVERFFVEWMIRRMSKDFSSNELFVEGFSSNELFVEDFSSNALFVERLFVEYYQISNIYYLSFCGLYHPFERVCTFVQNYTEIFCCVFSIL